MFVVMDLQILRLVQSNVDYHGDYQLNRDVW
jgi:hypothetical protein